MFFLCFFCCAADVVVFCCIIQLLVRRQSLFPFAKSLKLSKDLVLMIVFDNRLEDWSCSITYDIPLERLLKIKLHFSLNFPFWLVFVSWWLFVADLVSACRLQWLKWRKLRKKCFFSVNENSLFLWSKVVRKSWEKLTNYVLPQLTQSCQSPNNRKFCSV